MQRPVPVADFRVPFSPTGCVNYAKRLLMRGFPGVDLEWRITECQNPVRQEEQRPGVLSGMRADAASG